MVFLKKLLPNPLPAATNLSLAAEEGIIRKKPLKVAQHLSPVSKARNVFFRYVLRHYFGYHVVMLKHKAHQRVFRKGERLERRLVKSNALPPGEWRGLRKLNELEQLRYVLAVQ